MIGKLTGIIDSVGEDSCILDVNGVGYIIYCPSRILLACQAGQVRGFVICMLVKEDQLTLFGFNDEGEKNCFLNLQTVQGVGAKMALAILNALSPDKISLALMAEDTNAFKQVSGIGAKLASRITNELKNKAHIFYTGTQPVAMSANGTAKNDSGMLRDALSALTSLGFNKSEAFPVINRIYAANEHIGIDELIRNALSQLSKHTQGSSRVG